MNAHQLYTHQNLPSQQLQHLTSVNEILHHKVAWITFASLL